MKPKGISLVEQHCEKLFLVLLALAALGVVAMQFTGEGNSVTVGSGGEYRLDQAYEQVATVAEAKLGQLEDPRASQSAPEADTAYADQFVGALDQRPVMASGAPLTRPFVPIGSTAIEEDQLIVFGVEPDPPSPPITGVFLGTISPSAGAFEAFDEIYGSGEWPRDVRAISVETSFDAEAFRDLLNEDPDGAGPAQAAPVGFWRARHLVAEVTFERERRLENGEWGEARVVPTPPLALDARALIDAVQEPSDVGEIIALLKGEQRGWQVVAPSFVSTVPANTWLPPSLAVRLEQGGDPDVIAADLDRRIQQGTDLRDVQEMSLWTHDYRVKPGETYRYRARVTVPNPYFGFAPALAGESKSLAQEPFISSVYSEWGEPVTAPREAYWFAFSATDGSDGPLAGTASCRLDVFVFVGGKWRHKQERFEPGEAVRVSVLDDNGASHTVDTGARVLDVVKASLSEPGARGRQNPMQVVASSAEGLALREVWRDRASAVRRELLDGLDRVVPAAVNQPAAAAPREREENARGRGSDDGR